MDDEELDVKDGTTFLNGNIKPHVATCDDSSQSCFSQRWIFCYMGMVYGFITYMLNTNMSVAIVCMVKNSDVNIQDFNVPHSPSFLNITNATVSGEDTTFVNSTLNISSVALVDVKSVNINNVNGESGPAQTCQKVGESVTSPNAEFTWDKTTQSLILSGFFYGYIVAQIPGGWLSARFGGRVTIASCLSVSSIVTLFIPSLARWSPYALVVARVIIGIVSGIAMPSWFALIGQWALPNERNRFIGLGWFGQTFGVIFSFMSSGILCAYGFDNGWASVFYVHGLAGVLFVICWLLLVYSSPNTHPRISTAERNLLQKNIKIDVNAKKKMANLPWRKILTYVPVYAMITAHICDTWTFYLLLTCLPLYLKEVLQFDVASNGIFSSLPMISILAGIGVASLLADFIRSNDIFKVTTIRKTFQITGFLGIAAFILIPGYLTCDKRDIVIVCICLCTFFEALGTVGGYACNSVDMAPQYSSVIFSISNTVATLPGIIAPIAVAKLTVNQTSEEWRIVLFIAAGVAVFGAVIYGAFASSELAPWADEQSMEIEVELEKKACKDSYNIAEVNS